MTERCELTDLEVTACACRNHRNITLVDEEKWDCNRQFVALYNGTCARCKGNIFAHIDRIAITTATQVYIHAVCARTLSQ